MDTFTRMTETVLWGEDKHHGVMRRGVKNKKIASNDKSEITSEGEYKHEYESD